MDRWCEIVKLIEIENRTSNISRPFGFEMANEV